LKRKDRRPPFPRSAGAKRERGETGGVKKVFHKANHMFVGGASGGTFNTQAPRERRQVDWRKISLAKKKKQKRRLGRKERVPYS